MHADLHHFLVRLAGTVAMTLVPVVLVAFLSMPMALGRHPGELPVADGSPPPHMT